MHRPVANVYHAVLVLDQLNHFIKDVLDGNATMETLDTMEATALSIMESADCAIGYEAAHMVYKGLVGYRDDYIEHIRPRKMYLYL